MEGLNSMVDKCKIKKRNTTIFIELREDAQATWNETEQCLELRNSKGEIFDKHLISIGETYSREGKQPKVLRMIKSSTDGVISFLPETVAYDRYLAIDTSYKTFENYLLCATSCLSIEQNISGPMMKDEQCSILVWPRLIFSAKLGTKPERYGWMKVINSLLKSSLYNADRSYGVIVDSDLDDLQKINSRENSIIADFYVPKNISLIYASADTGMDNMFNKLIQQADQVAKKSLNDCLNSFDEKELFEPTRSYKEITTLTDDVTITF